MFRQVALCSSTFVNRNHMAAHLVLMAGTLLMTHSPLGTVAFSTRLLLVGGLFVLLHKEQRLRSGTLLVRQLLVDVLVVNHYVGMQNLIDSEARLITGQAHGSVFQAALSLAKNLLTGQGAGSFEVLLPKYVGADIGLHVRHAHNDYLQFLIEYGVLGSLPLLLFVLCALYHARMAMW